MSDLKGKAALVTGGGSGIGLATVRMLAERGASVAVNYLPSDERAADAIEQLRKEGHWLVHAPGDVSSFSEARRMVVEACAELGRLDMLVNNAARGTAGPVPFEDLDAMDEEIWQGILATNLLGPFSCVRAAAKELRRTRGAVVNLASVAGFGIRGSSIAYAASKAALVNLTGSLARALAPEVRVNAVAPGLVDTPWTASWPEERKRQTVKQSLLGRMAQPTDIAEVVVFLLTGTGFVNGETIIVDGGRA